MNNYETVVDAERVNDVESSEFFERSPLAWIGSWVVQSPVLGWQLSSNSLCIYTNLWFNLCHSIFHLQYIDFGEAPYAGECPELEESLEVSIRHGFVRKVFGILSMQLVVSFLLILAFHENQTLKDYIDLDAEDGGHVWPFWLAFCVSMVCVLILACFRDQARTFPNNYVFLSLFTCAEGVLLGFLCAAYELDVILLAAGITAGMWYISSFGNNISSLL